MKILFVIPNQRIRYKPSIDLPLGVLSIVSYLKLSGFDGEVKVYDKRNKGDYIKLLVKYVKEFIKNRMVVNG